MHHWLGSNWRDMIDSYWHMVGWSHFNIITDRAISIFPCQWRWRRSCGNRYFIWHQCIKDICYQNEYVKQQKTRLWLNMTNHTINRAHIWNEYSITTSRTSIFIASVYEFEWRQAQALDTIWFGNCCGFITKVSYCGLQRKDYSQGRSTTSIFTIITLTFTTI